MVRSLWRRTLVTSLAWAGLAWAQQPYPTSLRPVASPMPVHSTERIITVQEPGKPSQKCRIVKAWQTAEGATAYQVQALETGELMTIVESGPATTLPGSRAGTRMQAMATRIFHRGQDHTWPAETPVPPVEVVQMVPVPAPVPMPAPAVRRETVSPRPELAATQVVPPPAPPVKRPGFFARFAKKDDAAPTPTQDIVIRSDVPTRRLNGPVPTTSTGIVNQKEVAAQPRDGVVKKDATVKPSATYVKKEAAGIPQVGLRPSSPYAATGQASGPVSGTAPSVQAVPSEPRKEPGPRLVQLVLPGSEAQPVAVEKKSDDGQKPPSVVKPAEAPAPVAVKPLVTLAPAANPAVTAAPASDWRKSWGKTDDAKVAAPAKPQPPSADTQTAAVKPALPQADAKRPDPLQVPDHYSRVTLEEKPGSAKVEINYGPKVAPAGLSLPADGREPQSSRPEQAATQGVQPPAPPVKRSGFFGHFGKTDDAAPTPAPGAQPGPVSTAAQPVTPAMAAGQLPVGAGSVLGAAGGTPGAVRYVPVPIVTVPDLTRPPMPPMPRLPQPPQVFGQQNAGMGYGVPNRPWGPAPTTTDPGMVNAFTAMPTEQEVAKASNAFTSPDAASLAAANTAPAQAAYPRSPYGAMAQAMPAAGGPAGMGRGVVQVGYQTVPSYEQAQALQNVQQMQAVLHDSLYPSQREWAAESLSAVDWRTHPQVVQALLTAARDDPAATVRAASVRCLAKMNVNTVPVVSAVQALKVDPDPRVRQEADQALTVLAPSSAASLRQPILPTGGR